MEDFGEFSELEWMERQEYYQQIDREKHVKQLREIAEKIRRCDYTQARSDLLELIADYE